MPVRKGGLDNAITAAKDKGNAQKPNSMKRAMPLEDIKNRPHGNTRALNEEHVRQLMDSIAAVGLIQPLAIDNKGHLLAGGHRRAALITLEAEQPNRYAEFFSKGIPVRVFDFDAKADPQQAIAIEAAENEKRRDYTPAEVRALADKLLEKGYSYGTKGGKPKKGTKALRPAIALIIGKSEKTVQRYLNQDNQQTGTHVPVSEAPEREKLAKRAVRALQAMGKSVEFDDSEQRSIMRALGMISKLI